MGSYGSGAYGSGLYPGVLSQNEFSKFFLVPVLLVEIESDAGTQYASYFDARFSERHYKGTVLSVGPIRRSISRHAGLYEATRVEIELSDVDRVYSSLPEPIKGREVRIKAGTSAMAIGDYLTVFRGRVDDMTISNYSVVISAIDDLLSLPEFPDTGFVDATNFPNAFDEHRGLPLPVCYGTHAVTSDDDNRNRGAWPTLYVDNSSGAKKFLIAAHAVKSIDQVYVNRPTSGSTLLTVGADYTVFTAGTLAGRTMAWIQFTDAQFTTNVVDTGGVVGQVVCNVVGAEDAGNGSGTAITNPVDVVVHFLSNYCGGPMVDADTFAAVDAVCSSRSYVASGGYTAKKQVQAIIAEIAKSFDIFFFTKASGAIAVSIIDTSLFTDSSVFDEARDVLRGSWSVDKKSQIEGAEDAEFVNSVEYSYAYHHAKTRFFSQDKLDDTGSISMYGRKPFVAEMPWAGNFATANGVASRLLNLFRSPVAHASFRTVTRGLLRDVGESILVTHGNAVGGSGGAAYGSGVYGDGVYPGSSAWDEKKMQVLEHVFNPSDFTVAIRARDISSLE